MSFDVSLVAAEAAKQAGRDVVYYDSIASTNLEAKSRIGKNEIFIARHQTHGRGRYQRTWEDLPGDTLMMTYSRSVQFSPQPVLTAAVGLAVAKSLSKSLLQDFRLKPPNDVYLKDRKLGGILIENVQHEHGNQLIIGLGMNVLARPRNQDFEAATLADACLVNEIKLESFLKELWFELDKLSASRISSLDDDQRKGILLYLNVSDNVYKSVAADGSIQLDSGNWIQWSAI